MGFAESVYTAVSLMVIVFVVLICLYLCIKLFSFVLGKIQSISKKHSET